MYNTKFRMSALSTTCTLEVASPILPPVTPSRSCPMTYRRKGSREVVRSLQNNNNNQKHVIIFFWAKNWPPTNPTLGSLNWHILLGFYWIGILSAWGSYFYFKEILNAYFCLLMDAFKICLKCCKKIKLLSIETNVTTIKATFYLLLIVRH